MIVTIVLTRLVTFVLLCIFLHMFYVVMHLFPSLSFDRAHLTSLFCLAIIHLWLAALVGSLAELLGDGSAWIYRNGKDCRIISPSLDKYYDVSVLLQATGFDG